MSKQMQGVVRMGMIRRLPSLTPAEFSAHWSGPHGVFATRIPNLRRYHQNHAAAQLTLGALPDRWALDGLSQLWFDDIDSMLAGIRSPDYSGLAQDTPSVMTMPGLVVGRQEFVVGERPAEKGHAKAMAVLGRRGDVDRQTFLDDWRKRLAAVKGIDGLVAATAITIEHRESEPAVVVDYDALPVDLVAEFWFESEPELERAFSGGIQDRLRMNADAVTADVSAFMTKTFVIID